MSDYLSDEEQVERLKKWWSENGTSLVVTLMLAVGAVVGWRWYQDYSLTKAEAASDAYAQYLEKRQAGDETSALAERVITEHPGTVYAVFALLYQAKDAAESEDWERAAALLATSVEAADEDVVKDLARIRLARLKYQLDQTDEALAILGAVLSRGFASDVAELTGDIHHSRGDTVLAMQAYQAALDAAPEGTSRNLIALKHASVRLESPSPPSASTDES